MQVLIDASTDHAKVGIFSLNYAIYHHFLFQYFFYRSLFHFDFLYTSLSSFLVVACSYAMSAVRPFY